MQLGLRSWYNEGTCEGVGYCVWWLRQLCVYCVFGDSSLKHFRTKGAAFIILQVNRKLVYRQQCVAMGPLCIYLIGKGVPTYRKDQFIWPLVNGGPGRQCVESWQLAGGVAGESEWLLNQYLVAKSTFYVECCMCIVINPGLYQSPQSRNADLGSGPRSIHVILLIVI